MLIGTLYDNIAGEIATVELQLNDAYGNALQRGGNEIELALYGVAGKHPLIIA
jgi:hypothetical protein